MTTPRRPRSLAPRALALACLATLALILALAPTAAWAQGDPTPDQKIDPLIEADDGPQEAAPPQGRARSLAEQETSVPGGVLLLIAYILLWVILFVVLLLVMNKQRALAAELEVLEQRLERAFASHDDPDAQG